MAIRSDDKTRSEINLNFIIRWKNQGEKGSNLISAGQYHKIVGEELKNKHFARVLQGGADKYTFKIRGRLKIDFIGK